jgi:hypothetical protein
VPTKDDARQVQELAAKLRAKALDMQGLEQLEGVNQMNDAIRKRVLAAVENQGSNKYVTSSGAFLELLTELAKMGHLADISTAFRIFVKAHPSNAKFVAKSIGAKILNHFLIPSLGLNGVARFFRWQESHLDWAITLAESLPTSQFQRTVDEMLADIKGNAA